MVFLNHFQLSVRYDVGIELLANFEKKIVVHILDHIREWLCRKSLIKVKVPLAFFLEWFLNSLVPCVSKDITTSIFFPRNRLL
jgi:hypothetical protein